MDDKAIDIRQIFGLLRREMRLILVTMLLVLGVAVLVSFALKPIFTASALVLVDPSRKNLLDPEAQFGNAVSDNARVDSEVELARSDNVLLKVIVAENLQSDPEFATGLGWRSRILAFLRLREPTPPAGAEALTTVLNGLRSSVNVRRRGLTYLISIEGQSDDPEKAARIANGVAKAYIEEQVLAKVNSITTSQTVLQDRIAQARNAIASSEGGFDANIEPVDRQGGDPIIAGLAEELARRQYEMLLSRGQDMDTQAGLQIADSRIVSPALAPSYASFPNIRLLLTLAGIAGLALGIVLAFLRENYVGGFTSEQQAETVLRHKIAAALPRQKALRAGATSHGDAVVTAPLSFFSEATRRVRAELD